MKYGTLQEPGFKKEYELSVILIVTRLIDSPFPLKLSLLFDQVILQILCLLVTPFMELFLSKLFLSVIGKFMGRRKPVNFAVLVTTRFQMVF